MLIQQNPPLHLTYCLNVHTGESWPEVLNSIREISLSVRDQWDTCRPFGLGLRLGAAAAADLSRLPALADFSAFLQQENLYVPTINGFPYGSFHGTRIKEKVYAPDWRSTQRRDYTLQLANILAACLPEGANAPISTVPCSYRSWIQSPDDIEAMTQMLMDTVVALARLHVETGKEIHLALEPEPDCYLETPADVIRFMNDILLVRGTCIVQQALSCTGGEAEILIRRHLGICLDTCHASVHFDDPLACLESYLAAGIRVGKVQCSAAVETIATPAGQMRLKAFDDHVYLHQVTGLLKNQKRQWPDLSDALLSADESERLRVHCHVPLSWAGHSDLRSTRDDLNTAFFKRLSEGATQHLEIETYTFHVLPEFAKETELVESILSEYRWVLKHFPDFSQDDPIPQNQ